MSRSYTRHRHRYSPRPKPAPIPAPAPAPASEPSPNDPSSRELIASCLDTFQYICTRVETSEKARKKVYAPSFFAERWKVLEWVNDGFHVQNQTIPSLELRFASVGMHNQVDILKHLLPLLNGALSRAWEILKSSRVDWEYEGTYFCGKDLSFCEEHIDRYVWDLRRYCVKLVEEQKRKQEMEREMEWEKEREEG